jgi:hypothetical protein
MGRRRKEEKSRKVENSEEYQAAGQGEATLSTSSRTTRLERGGEGGAGGADDEREKGLSRRIENWPTGFQVRSLLITI